MNETVGEGKVADQKEDSQAGFTFICVKQLSGHNLIMSHNANSELSEWNLSVKKSVLFTSFKQPRWIVLSNFRFILD